MVRLLSFLALLACALLVAVPAAAQDPETFFHRAAQSYIGKDVPEAKRQVDAGLRVAPSDPKLLALREKLKQQEQQQQGGSSGQGQPQDQQDQNQKGQQDGEQQESEDQKEEQENEQQGDEQSPEDPQEGEENQDNASDGQPGETQQQPLPDPGALTEAQAERILQALQNQEKQLLREVQRGRPVRGRATDKDW